VETTTRAEFQRLLASGALFERYAQMEKEIDALALEMQNEDWGQHTTHPISVEAVVNVWVGRLRRLL
jgi:hypothetical protein